jgi:hypothetical protein
MILKSIPADSRREETQVTESATSTGTLVWFELPSADTEKARGFYSGLFGWTFESFGGQDYQMTSGGAVYNDPSSTGLMAYFDVEDIDAAAARVQELGGTAGDKQEIPGVGFYVRCVDLDGNNFGLYEGAAS